MSLDRLRIYSGLAVLFLSACSSNNEYSPPESVAPTPTASRPTEPLVSPTSQPSSENRTSGSTDLGYGIGIPAGGPGDCTAAAYIYLGNIDGEEIAEVLGSENLVDMGPIPSANGEVGYDIQGNISTYTVAQGDVIGAIGNRLCIYNADALAQLNGHGPSEPITVGEVLNLHSHSGEPD